VTQALPIVERILLAVKARLDVVAIDGEELFTDRNRQEEVPSYPALVLQDGDQESDEDQTVFVQFFRTIAVEGFVRVESKDDLGPAVNLLWAEAVKTVQADLSLGGLSIDIRLGEYRANLAPTDDSQWIGEFSQVFTIQYATRHGDPYTLAP
jgi:hypothetical protein